MGNLFPGVSGMGKEEENHMNHLAIPNKTMKPLSPKNPNGMSES